MTQVSQKTERKIRKLNSFEDTLKTHRTQLVPHQPPTVKVHYSNCHTSMQD